MPEALVSGAGPKGPAAHGLIQSTPCSRGASPAAGGAGRPAPALPPAPIAI
jgi:hypothetical protein